MLGLIFFVFVPEDQCEPVQTLGELAVEVASFLKSKTETTMPISIYGWP